MPIRWTKVNSGVNKEKSPELKKKKKLGKFKRNILLLNISLFTVQDKWIVPRDRGASSFLFPQMGSPI